MEKSEKKKGSGTGSYKMLIIIPVALIIFSAAVLVNNVSQTGEWFTRSIELKGGTLLTIKTTEPVNIIDIEDTLSIFGQVVVRELRSFSGSGLSIEVDAEVDTDQVLEKIRGLGIEAKDFSIETIGSALGETFWVQAQFSIVIAFIFMAMIVFIVFRMMVPSLAVVLAAVSDIVVTLALMQVFGIPLSLASFAALLMLIGYSIDTNILLTTRLVKRTEGSVDERVKGAFKTGITMTGTTLGVLFALMVTTTSVVLFQIAAVLMIGLVADIVNTWLMNSTILKYHCRKRGMA